jgi:hypothetical protein
MSDPSTVDRSTVDPSTFDYHAFSARFSQFLNDRLEANRSSIVAAVPSFPFAHRLTGFAVDTVEKYIPSLADDALGWLAAEFEKIRKMTIDEAMAAVKLIFAEIEGKSSYGRIDDERRDDRTDEQSKDEHA